RRRWRPLRSGTKRPRARSRARRVAISRPRVWCAPSRRRPPRPSPPAHPLRRRSRAASLLSAATLVLSLPALGLVPRVEARSESEERTHHLLTHPLAKPFLARCSGRRRRSVALAACQDGPGDARSLVGESHRRQLAGLARHEPRQPGMLVGTGARLLEDGM